MQNDITEIEASLVFAADNSLILAQLRNLQLKTEEGKAYTQQAIVLDPSRKEEFEAYKFIIE